MGTRDCHDRDELQELYDAVIQEICDLGELWLEWHAARRDTKQVEVAIAQAIRESRRYEKKLRSYDARLG